jgi:putative membrane protein
MAGCLALALGASVVGAQATPPGSPAQTSPNSSAPAGSPQSPRTGVPGAQNDPAGTTQTSSGANAGMNTAGASKASDKMFVKKAMAGGMAEVKLGQLASQKGNSEDVKQFGQKMVDDHTKLNDQMKPIAGQLGVEAPADLSAKDKALQTRLEGLSGDAFDKAYMSAMVKDHKKDLTEFKHEATAAKDPQVQQAAQQGAQVIEEHLQMAEQIAQKVGATGGKSDKSGNAKGSNSGTAPQ